MALEFNEKSFAQMMAVEAAIMPALLRAKDQRVEAAVVAFALVRAARVLLDQYPENARKLLVDGTIVPFLEHQQQPGSILLS